MAKQYGWNDANELADKAADNALGFGPRSGKVTVNVEDIIRIARIAALNALELSGSLDRMHAAHRRWNNQQADRAQREHDAWRRRTGQPC